MSYQYSQSSLLTISNENLTNLALTYGHQDSVAYACPYQIAERFNTENQGSAIAEVEHNADGPSFLTVTLIERISEREGIAGVKALAERYKGVVDSAEVTFTDEHGQSAIVKL